MALQFRPGEAYMQRLRDAMFSDQGVDNDVLRQCSAFAKFDRNELNVEFEFATGRTLSAKSRKFIFGLAKQQMEQIINDSGHGWDDEEREDEIREEVCRYLLVRQKEDRKLCGFVDFRFSVQGDMAEKFEGFPVLQINDVQLTPDVQRKGLGRHLLMTLEMIARKQQMTFLTMKVFKGNTAGEAFISEKLKGFKVDNTWVSTAEPYQVMQKCLAPGDLEKEGFAGPSSPMAVSPPTKPKAEAATPAIPKAAPVKLDSAFAAAIKLTQPAKPEPVKEPEPEPADVLAFFYETVVNEAKTQEQITDIIEKRRRLSPTWFDTLCGKLAKKYGKEPRAAWKENETAKASAEANEAEGVEQDKPVSPEAARSTAMESLAKVYEEQHGSEPGPEEMARWQASFDAAIAGAKAGVDKEGENALPSFGLGQK